MVPFFCLKVRLPPAVRLVDFTSPPVTVALTFAKIHAFSSAETEIETLHEVETVCDTVQVLVRGPGFAVQRSASALTHGVEGQPVRLRTEEGYEISGVAVGQNRVEVQL